MGENEQEMWPNVVLLVTAVCALVTSSYAIYRFDYMFDEKTSASLVLIVSVALAAMISFIGSYFLIMWALASMSRIHERRTNAKYRVRHFEEAFAFPYPQNEKEIALTQPWVEGVIRNAAVEFLNKCESESELLSLKDKRINPTVQQDLLRSTQEVLSRAKTTYHDLRRMAEAAGYEVHEKVQDYINNVSEYQGETPL